MKSVFAVLVCAGLATTASASVITFSPTGPAIEREFGPNSTRALGSLVNTGSGVFNGLGGAILTEADPHTIGTTEAMFNALSRPSTVSSSVSTVGNVRTVTIAWSTDGGVAMIQPGDGLGGQPIQQVSFELGTPNFPLGGINDPDFIAFDHAESATPGTFSANFTLLDAAGGSIFAGTWFVNLTGAGEIAGRTFVAAGGADLANFNIGGGVASVSYFVVPAPGSLALLGLGGLVATRRRRA